MPRKLAVEAIGTFFLVFTIGMVVLEPGAGAVAPFAIGAVLMVMVYAGGHVSGAHYNPAVSVAVWLRGLAPPLEVAGYWAAQVAGAVVAALAALRLKDAPGATPAVFDTGAVLLAEFLFTFALVWVILNVATARGTKGNSYFGLAIGFTVLAGAYAVGPVSGAAFNPAVTVALVVLGLLETGNVWVYLVAQFAAAVAAALLFKAFVLSIDKPTTATPGDQTRLEPAASTGE